MPKVPPAAKVAVEKPPEYPYLRNSGKATRPMVAAVASDEPQIEPNPAQAPIAAIAMPPLRWPKKLSAALNRALDMPPRVAKCPISKNIGTIDKE